MRVLSRFAYTYNMGSNRAIENQARPNRQRIGTLCGKWDIVECLL
jgi:hypothetical protein